MEQRNWIKQQPSKTEKGKEMTRFELFCMIFYVLDSEWDETKNKHLGSFLSAANPFLFEDVGSADPAVYKEFCNAIDRSITIEDSYKQACSYIDSLHDPIISAAFKSLDQHEWSDCVREYLSTPHKRGN